MVDETKPVEAAAIPPPLSQEEIMREQKRREDRARDAAKRFGYDLKKDRKDGTFTVIAPEVGVPFAEGWTIDEVEEWINA